MNSSNDQIYAETLRSVMWILLLVPICSHALDPSKMYDEAIRSVMWIITDDRQASGVLIEKKNGNGLAVTNEHVTKDHKEVRVVFPVRDAYGNLIGERKFYADESNQGVLERLGYATSGRVIAIDPENDLAMVHISGLPETARPISHDFNNHAYRGMKPSDPVYILGNPTGRDLWRWTAGHFQGVNERLLHINAGTYGGNSGGPVLNNQGVLIGILSSGDLLMNTYAIPSEYIEDLYMTLQVFSVFSIQNKTQLTVPYQIQWIEDGEWTEYAIEPSQILPHYYEPPHPQSYPNIRFDYIVDDEVSVKSYRLKPYIKIFGSDIKERIRYTDGHQYHFKYNPTTKEVDLFDSEE
ncbi:MAG: trypsin-like serine protease [Gemmatimonadetes bacterium]|nr:trypsin-like serine protease [Gemmatimonadota bacterium]MYB71701.1 trypsin-like serine protease [Gemmatimonadota bacterium]